MDLNLVTALTGSGYGFVGLNLLRALVAGGHDVALFRRMVSGPELDLDPAETALVLRCLRKARAMNMAAPCVRIAGEDDMTLFAGRGPRCGLAFFDTDGFSDVELRHLRSLDRLFVASEWGRAVAIAGGLDPAVVATLPMGVDRGIFFEADVRPTGPTTFLHIGAWQQRKGQDVLLEAFARAFAPGDDVELRLLCSNPSSAIGDERWHEQCRRSPMADHITVVPRLRRRSDVADLMRASDCGVFPSRSEAWNLELLEMMSCGRPVIATGYAGHTEFADPGNALLVDIDELEPAEDPVWMPVFTQRKVGAWAHLGPRQLDQLVEHLRTVHRRKQDGVLAMNGAGVATAERYTWEHSARRLVDGLP